MPEEPKSAMPCGCDPGINYISPHCEEHRAKSVIQQFACGLMLEDEDE